jgi:hypothetical protein
MLMVKNASYQSNYRIWVEFNNGENGIVDLNGALWGTVFEPLKDLNEFKKFRVSEIFNTIVWENGADLAPEFLHKHLVKTEKTAA